MSEDLIITEEELNSLLNNLDLKFIAQKLKIENVDKSIITLIKIVKSLQQENKQLKEELQEANDNIIWWSNRFNAVERDNKQLKEALETKYYCQYANKCNELYDCTREEYETMAQSNMKLSLEIAEVQQENKQLKSILTELEEWLENNWKSTQDIWYVKIINKIQELKEKYK